MATIIKQTNKKSGVCYVYSQESYWVPDLKQPRSHRRLIGKIDPATGAIVPTGKSGRRSLVTNGMTANNITANGTFQCGTDFVLYLSNGTMSGWRNISGEGLSELAEINFTAAGTSQITGQTAYGMKMYATDLIMMQTPKIYIGDNSDPYVYSGVTTTVSKSFQVTVNNVTQTIGSVHLEFINGICVGCLVGGT